VRERTGRTVLAEQRNAHRLAGALLDSFRARILIEVRLRKAGRHGVDLDSLRFQLDRHRERQSVESRLRRRVDRAENRAVRVRRV
jgi:hypothetical protein